MTMVISPACSFCAAVAVADSGPQKPNLSRSYLKCVVYVREHAKSASKCARARARLARVRAHLQCRTRDRHHQLFRCCRRRMSSHNKHVAVSVSVARPNDVDVVALFTRLLRNDARRKGRASISLYMRVHVRGPQVMNMTCVRVCTSGESRKSRTVDPTAGIHGRLCRLPVILLFSGRSIANMLVKISCPEIGH